jgi:hypothetical protein
VVSDPPRTVAKGLHPKNSVGLRELVNEVELSNLPVCINSADLDIHGPVLQQGGGVCNAACTRGTC